MINLVANLQIFEGFGIDELTTPSIYRRVQKQASLIYTTERNYGSIFEVNGNGLALYASVLMLIILRRSPISASISDRGAGIAG